MIDPKKEKIRESNRLAKQKSRSNPEIKAREKARKKTPEAREKWLAYLRKRYQRPEVKKRIQDSQNLRYATDPEFRKRRMEYQRYKLRGMSPELFESLLALQDGKCAICGVVLKGGKHTHADHCHDSNKPRGLLCTYCNLIEGMITNVNLSPLEFGQRLHYYLLNPPANRLS